MNCFRTNEARARIAIVAHCILNQNSRVLGLAERSSMIAEIVESLMRNNVGIVQMSCPELTYAGVLRKPQTKHQYDTAIFRSHCKRIAKEIVEQIQEYAKYRISTEIVIGVDGSPSCGVSETSEGSSCGNMSKHGKAKGSGFDRATAFRTKRKGNFSAILWNKV